jgi:hypothetical protein
MLLGAFGDYLKIRFLFERVGKFWTLPLYKYKRIFVSGVKKIV